MVGDTTFFYRRLPPTKRRDLLAEYAVRGTFDATAVLGLELAVAQHCLRGWENLLDAEGKQVPFLEEVIPVLAAQYHSAGGRTGDGHVAR